MRPPMRHTVYKQTTTRNAYGDFISSGEIALPCHFREINEQVTTNVVETVQSDAMAWFLPDSGVDREDIIRFGSDYYRVERVIKARRLHHPDVQFIKTELLRYGVIS